MWGQMSERNLRISQISLFLTVEMIVLFFKAVQA